MSITSTIYSEFVEGTSFEELYYKHKRSSSALYTAWRKFVTVKDKELADIQSELSRTKTELERVQTEAKVQEAKQTSYSRQVVELKKLLTSLRDEEQVALGVLEQFRKMGLAPTVALELLKRSRDLAKEISWQQARVSSLERERDELTRQVGLTKESLSGWSSRLSSERSKVTFTLAASAKAVEVQRQAIARTNQQRVFILMELDRLSKVLAELEPKVQGSMKEAKALADRMRCMRARMPKLSFIDDQLKAEIAKHSAEVEGLKHQRDELRATLQRAIDAEAARGHRVDIEFSTKTEALKTSYEQLIAQGDAETEKTIRQRVGDRLERLPVELERCADITIQLVALGVQRGTLLAEIEQLNGRREELVKPNLIRGLVVTS